MELTEVTAGRRFAHQELLEDGQTVVNRLYETVRVIVPADQVRDDDLVVAARPMLGAVEVWRAIPVPGRVGTCRACSCTDDDCSGCVERTGSPCHWVEADLCSACAPGVPAVT